MILSRRKLLSLITSGCILLENSYLDCKDVILLNPATRQRIHFSERDSRDLDDCSNRESNSRNCRCNSRRLSDRERKPLFLILSFHTKRSRYLGITLLPDNLTSVHLTAAIIASSYTYNLERISLLVRRYYILR